MPITRDFGANGQFTLTDWTSDLVRLPNDWGTINNLGIFSNEAVTQHTVSFDEMIQDGALLVDTVRGQRNTQGKNFTRKIHTFAVPHFTYDDTIYPKELQGNRAYGSVTEAENFQAVLERKMIRARRNHARTLEKARAVAITEGTVYSPNGTVTQDWYQEFTGTSRPAPIDFLFGTSTTDMVEKGELARQKIIIDSGSVSMTGVIALCNTTFFSKLISHATIRTAYQFYNSTQEPLRMRLAASNSGTAAQQARTFFHGGITYIEMLDSYEDSNNVLQPLIPAGEAYFLPTGTEYFKTYFGPAERFDLVNTLGEQAYMFEYMAPNGSCYNLETESNHVSALLKPLLVVRAYSSN